MSSYRIQLWISDAHGELYDELNKYRGRKRAERLRQLAMIGLYHAQQQNASRTGAGNQSPPSTPGSSGPEALDHGPYEKGPHGNESSDYSAAAARSRASRLKGSFE